jgi:hypothetical protein
MLINPVTDDLMNLENPPMAKFYQTITEGSGAYLITGQFPSMYLLFSDSEFPQQLMQNRLHLPYLNAFLNFLRPFML